MLSIHSEVQDFGNEDETNMNEYCIFIADQKSENTKYTTKYGRETLCKFCQKKYE